ARRHPVIICDEHQDTSADQHRVVCENVADGLRDLAIVELEQAAESLTTLHLACPNHRRLWRNEFVLQALVRPFFMIMADKFSEGMSLALLKFSGGSVDDYAICRSS